MREVPSSLPCPRPRKSSVFIALAAACLTVGANAQVAMAPQLTRSYQDYVAPPVSLVRTDGKSLSFADLVDGSRPVVLEFFYTSCSTICGMQASTLALARKGFGSNAITISVTIDPEYDTPARLQQFGQNFNAGGNWYLLTGKRADIQRVLTAFDARPFGDNKMLHRPLVFIRPAKGRQWLRLDGLANASQIISAFKSATQNPPPPSSTVSILHETFNRLVG